MLYSRKNREDFLDLNIGFEYKLSIEKDDKQQLHLQYRVKPLRDQAIIFGAVMNLKKRKVPATYYMIWKELEDNVFKALNFDFAYRVYS